VLATLHLELLALRLKFRHGARKPNLVLGPLDFALLSLGFALFLLGL
jgi:hypothetical protein